jgi:PIN domain nuclease of toxin-antitoxin system
LERSEIVVLDTHAWVWWISSPEELSRKAKKAIDAAAGHSSIYVSAISVWEVSLLVTIKRIQLTMDVDDWIARCEALPFLNFVPVDNLIATKANRLINYTNRDPADRMIIATAILLGGTVITKDRKILDYSHASSRW